MNPGKQRIKIAEACGWRWCSADRGLPPDALPVIENICFLPDYLYDLNAMHEAENQCVWTSKWAQYKVNLRWVCERDKDQFGHYDCVRATAAQRAEAFLRTLNLWEEEP